MPRYCKDSAIILMVVLVCLAAACSREQSDGYGVLMEAGQAAFEQGRYDDAVNAWGRALEIAPENSDLLLLMAKAHQRSARFDSSTLLLRQAVERGHQPLEAYFMIAQNEILVGNFEAAAHTARILEAMAPNDYRLLVVKGDIASFMGRYGEGQALYQQAVALDGRRSEAYFKLAANLLVQEEEDRADDYFRQATALVERGSVPYWLHRAEYMALKGQVAAAEAAMHQALALEPDNFYIKLKIAQLLLAYRQYTALLDFFADPDDLAAEHPEVQKLIVEALLNTSRLEPARAIISRFSASSDSEWLLLAGKYNLLQGTHTEAIIQLEQALEKRRHDPHAHYLLALAYLAADRIHLAGRTLIQLLAVFPEMNEAELALAAIHFTKAEYDLSAGYLQRLIQRAPENPRAYLLLGNCLLATGRYPEAALNFQKALSLDPASAPARYYLALTHERAGRPDEAMALYRSMVEELSGLVDAGLRMADLAGREKQSAETAAFFTALLEKQPHDSYLKFMLGTVHEASGDADKASAFYRQAIADNPHLLGAYMRLLALETQPPAKIAIIVQALQNLPGATELQMRLASLYLEAGKLDSAADLMEQVYRANPQDPAAANNLAWIYLESEANPARAHELATSAFEMAPDNPFYAHTLGWSYHQKGILQQARWHLAHALRLLADQPDLAVANPHAQAVFAYHLALALVAAGQVEEGKEKLASAVAAGLPQRYQARARALLE